MVGVLVLGSAIVVRPLLRLVLPLLLGGAGRSAAAVVAGEGRGGGAVQRGAAQAGAGSRVVVIRQPEQDIAC